MTRFVRDTRSTSFESSPARLNHHTDTLRSVIAAASTHHKSGRASSGRAIATLLAVAGSTALSGCSDSPAAFGPNAATARHHAEELFLGFQERFTRVERSPAFANARVKLGRAALIPSRVYDDSSVWSSLAPDSTRTLTVGGHYTGDHYIFAVLPLTTEDPKRLAESRHEVRLVRVGKNQYQWTTSVIQVVGSITADDVDRVVGSMLTAAATASQPALEAGSRATFPRTALALGQLLSLDTVRKEPRADGSTLVRLSIGIHPDDIRAQAPAYAAALHKYVPSARIRCTLSDPRASTDSGAGTAATARWFEVQLADSRLTLTMRATRDGHFAPLEGAPRPMPDSLALLVNVHEKAWLFSVGFTDLVADFMVERSAHVRGWHVRFHHEPKWHLPFFVDHLVRSPLRRPFTGEGADYRILVRDTSGGPTRLVRGARVDVQESTIMKWLGGLGASTMGEFSGKTEAEEIAFYADVFAALRADINAVLRTASAAGETTR